MDERRLTYAEVADGRHLSIRMEQSSQQLNNSGSDQTITAPVGPFSELEELVGDYLIPPFHVDPLLSPPSSPESTVVGASRPWTSSAEPLSCKDARTAGTALRMEKKLWNPSDSFSENEYDECCLHNPGYSISNASQDALDSHSDSVEPKPGKAHSELLSAGNMTTPMSSAEGSSSPNFEGYKNSDQLTNTSGTADNAPTVKMTAPTDVEVQVSNAMDDDAEPARAGPKSTEAKSTRPESIGSDSQASSLTKRADLTPRFAKGKGKEPSTEKNSSTTEDLSKATEHLSITSVETSSAGDEKKRKESDLKEAMLRALDQGDTPLWENNVGWDVLIQCRGHTWRVHRDILCEQSPEWMAKYIPPKLPNKAPVTWKLDSHDPRMLGNALQFMYLRRFEHGEMDPEYPYETGCIVTNVAMYIAATSVRCRNMMDMAINNLEGAGEIIETAAPDLAHMNVESFQEPLRRALLIMYEQPDQWIMRGLRLAMARLVATFYGFIVLNPAWARYETEWMAVHHFIMEDNMFFGQSGCLRLVPAIQSRVLNALVIQAYNGTRTAPQLHTANGASASSATRARARVTSLPITSSQQGLPVIYNLNTASGPVATDKGVSSGQPNFK